LKVKKGLNNSDLVEEHALELPDSVLPPLTAPAA